ncbi:MaoC/PaaZ C-terminal domain-containing protein [Nocardioides panzhihuensis]|uniref:Acyl dehydratase n=1 Tax=Nocardioides panzhihuensis TaxID=860243 RepID=A0A7Z0ISP0_9ACTN|nr:MaoC/PaaZ C-terminal domain-containing protein [Nocardioides panzhihuensis]NYI78141.1 acyl dehydratase [Nocardioides panzhihuensis]
MSLDQSVVGVRSEPEERSWTSADTLLYALGAGAGHDDPLTDLAYTTEHGDDACPEQKVLPTFGVMVTWGARRGGRRMGDFNPAMLVHAEQEVVLHRPLTAEGTVSLTSQVTGMYDKGSGALVTSQAEAVDPATGEPVVTTRSSVFIRGEGGFGGDPGPKVASPIPGRDPDDLATMPTWPGQALLYRLSGDRNPLHSDPRFSARGGFERPILHGLCTYGVTGRALVRTITEGDGDRLATMSGRFSAPVLPGETLQVAMWRVDDTTTAFQTRKEDGTVVIDRGLATWR